MLEKLKWFNIALRGTMEAGILGAFGYWGYYSGQSISMKIIFGFGAPLLGFGFWGIIDFHQAGSIAETLRLLEELFISGLAAFVLFIAGQNTFGFILAIVSIIHHTLVYMLGEKLLKN